MAVLSVPGGDGAGLGFGHVKSVPPPYSIVARVSFARFSEQLWRATRGGVHVGGVQVVVPAQVWRVCGAPPPHAPTATWHSWNDADLAITPENADFSFSSFSLSRIKKSDSFITFLSWRCNITSPAAPQTTRPQQEHSPCAGGGEWAWGPEGSSGVGVSQHEGCGRPGHRITLDADLLQELTEDDLPTLRARLPCPPTLPRHPPQGRRPHTHSLHRQPRRRTLGGRLRVGPVPGGSRRAVPVGAGRICPAQHLAPYHSDLPQVWEFCDTDTHDKDSPTPHNLLCGANSVWDVMRRHPDFTLNHATSTTAPATHSPLPVSLHTAPDPSGASFSPIPAEESTQGGAASEDTSTERQKFPTASSDQLHPSASPLGGSSGAPGDGQVTHSDREGSVRLRRRRSGVSPQPGVIPMRPSLVTAHIAASSSASSPSPSSLPLLSSSLSTRGFSTSTEGLRAADLTFQHDPTTRQRNRSHAESSRRVDVQQQQQQHQELNGDETGKERKEEEGRRANNEDWAYLDLTTTTTMSSVFPPPSSFSSSSLPSSLPPPPEIEFLAPAPSVVVLALDLSDQAIAQVAMEEMRGGVLRWLWGLGEGVRVGVVAAYRNSSYPLTLGPLLPAPTTAAELEDELALLPSGAEVESGAYGGLYCLDCVLDEAAKMLEDNGVVAGSGVLLLAACNPLVTPSHLSHPSIAIVHTLALCSSTTPFLDQLAHPEGAWVLSGTSPSEENSGDETGEQRVAEVLTAATQAALAFPGDPMLTKVGGVMVAARRSSVESSGPYSTVRGQVTLPQTSDSLLIVITTQHHAKIVEITSPLGKEVDLVRDSSQRFWAVMEQGGGRGNFSYALKFLTSSVAFPVPIAVDVYARRPNSEGVTVTLHTSNSAHHPLEPNSPPLVVWARVTHGGRPVVGARVLLRVSRLSESGAADTTVELLDNGNAEPDVRAQDGVYTRYLTWLPGEGRYALSAHATDHQGAASVLRLRRRDGRMVPISAGQFVKSSGTVTLTVARVTSADLVPPSRITDLAVTPLHGTFVNLTWSAPGGDLDQGSAWQYELKMYTEHDALSEHRFNTSTIAVYCITQDLRTPTPPPAPYGTPQHCLTELPFTNLRWYFAIRAIDAANNTGSISNVVSAFVPDLPTTSPSNTPVNHESSNIQTVIMSTIPSPDDPWGNATSSPDDRVTAATPDWRVWVAVGVVVGGVVVAVAVVALCVCCCRRDRGKSEKDPDRPVYKIYVNNAYIQEEDGEIKVVSNGKLVDDKEPSQVQEWVNSLSKFGSSDVYGGEPGEPITAPPEAPLVECRPRASVKYASPVRFGVLTNGSIMRDGCQSSSSTSSSKPSEDTSNEDVKYRDLSETTSNSTTDGGASAASTATTDTVPLPLPPPPPLASLGENARAVPVTVQPSETEQPLPPPPPPPSQVMPQPLGIPGPTVISIHSGPSLNSGYSSDEDGGFRPRTVPGPGPRRYLPTHFSSFRYLPPPPEYRSAVSGSIGISGAVDYPTCHTISRAATTLPHGTVRSVKKRRHISFV
ncbi:uncharacterized protein LOC123505181 [Portunus trituberculatus]|uniref:uncharacterized protein LOC123505181 n=1 Tax=Portunus trituberculatus TaxID=210409 RepID=UPI001E1D1C45|nr:uncharacterized protein LOC123505181 [Portunus trituberculatus]